MSIQVRDLQVELVPISALAADACNAHPTAITAFEMGRLRALGEPKNA
jgi:hypothetical protein